MTALATRTGPTGNWRSQIVGLAWLVGLAVALVGLHALGRGELAAPPVGSLKAVRSWLDHGETPTLAFALLRLVALAGAWYLLGVTLLGLIGQAVRLPGLVRIADHLTVPVVRRLLATMAGLTITASTAALVSSPPAAAAMPATSSFAAADATKPAPSRRRPDDRPVVMERVAPPRVDTTATMRVVERPRAPAATAAPRTWSPAPGDSFWSRAETELTAAWRRPVTDAEIVPYWQVLVEQNRARLVDSANADLIYPGQSFELPPAPPAP